jgi:translation elongation factor EF-4
LAGLFMLRTFIEQYVSSTQPDSEEKIDTKLKIYSKSLPDSFTGTFPSLKEIYEKLSSAIHKADENEELFNTSCENIILHFDAKRVYETARRKLDDT